MGCMGLLEGFVRMRVVRSLARGKRTKCRKMGLAVLVKRGGEVGYLVLEQDAGIKISEVG